VPELHLDGYGPAPGSPALRPARERGLPETDTHGGMKGGTTLVQGSWGVRNVGLPDMVQAIRAGVSGGGVCCPRAGRRRDRFQGGGGCARCVQPWWHEGEAGMAASKKTITKDATPGSSAASSEPGDGAEVGARRGCDVRSRDRCRQRVRDGVQVAGSRTVG
jgi:hypothetical protein